MRSNQPTLQEEIFTILAYGTGLKNFKRATSDFFYNFDISLAGYRLHIVNFQDIDLVTNYIC